MGFFGPDEDEVREMIAKQVGDKPQNALLLAERANRRLNELVKLILATTPKRELNAKVPGYQSWTTVTQQTTTIEPTLENILNFKVDP